MIFCCSRLSIVYHIRSSTLNLGLYRTSCVHPCFLPAARTERSHLRQVRYPIDHEDSGTQICLYFSGHVCCRSVTITGRARAGRQAVVSGNGKANDRQNQYGESKSKKLRKTAKAKRQYNSINFETSSIKRARVSWSLGHNRPRWLVIHGPTRTPPAKKQAGNY